MKNNKNLGVILIILKILQQETDQDHLITQKDIVKRLKENGIHCRLYTVEKHLDCLRSFGYNIQTVKGYGTYLKNDGLNIDDVYILLESLNRANLALEKDYLITIQNKIKNQLNKYEIEELQNKNMLL